MATAATSTSDIVNEDLDLDLSQGLDSDAKNKELNDKDILILDNEDSICDLVESSYSAKFDVSNCKDEEFYHYVELDNNMINIQWDEKMHFRENKDRRKKIKDKLLLSLRGKFMVDYKKLWGKDNSYNLIPTDIVCILKEEDNLEKTKELIITKLKSVGFNLKISTINGEEILNFESDYKNQSFKDPGETLFKDKKDHDTRNPRLPKLIFKIF